MEKYRIVVKLIRGGSFTSENVDKIEVSDTMVIVSCGINVSVFPIQNIKYYNFEIIPNGR